MPLWAFIALWSSGPLKRVNTHQWEMANAMLHGKRRCAAVPSCNFPWRQVRCTHGVRHLWEIHKQMPRDNQRWVGHWYQLEAWNLSEWRLSGTHKRASCGLEPSWQGLSVQHMLQTHRQWFVDWTSRAAARHPTSALQRRSSAELNSFVWNDKDRNQRQHDDRHLWSRKQIEGWWIGRPLFCVLILRERGFLDYDLRVRVAWILRCKASLEFEVTFSDGNKSKIMVLRIFFVRRQDYNNWITRPRRPKLVADAPRRPIIHTYCIVIVIAKNNLSVSPGLNIILNLNRGHPFIDCNKKRQLLKKASHT